MKNNLPDEYFSIGSPEAWDPQERENLPHNFLPIKQFSYISEPEKIFLCGRRGTGKSAIALMLQSDAPYEYKEAVPGEREQYSEYINIVDLIGKECSAGATINVKQAIQRLWLWVLPIKVMQTVLNQTKEAFDSELATMQAYFKSLPPPLHEGSTIGHLLSNTFKEALSILQQEGEGAFNRYLVNLTQTKEFKGAVQALHKKIMSKKTKFRSVIVVLDTLESYRIFEPLMVEGLQGILEAIITFRTDKRMEGISLKFFIPAEIYDSVISGFPGKVQPKAVFLRRSAPDLLAMLARRYLAILERTEAVPKQNIKKLNDIVKEIYESNDGRHAKTKFWYDNRFLPKTVINRRTIIEEDCFAYMIRHTQRRPRDLMMQMQSIINEARARGEFPYISKESVVAGVHNKREALLPILQDALAPYEGRLPGGLINSARSIFSERPVLMKGRDLRQFAQELYALRPLENIDSNEFVSLLISCGIIGKVEKEEPSEEPEKYCTGKFEYIMQGKIPLSDRFLYCIHPVMGDIFGMLPAENRGVIYPNPDRQEDRWLEDEIGLP